MRASGVVCSVMMELSIYRSTLYAQCSVGTARRKRKTNTDPLVYLNKALLVAALQASIDSLNQVEF